MTWTNRDRYLLSFVFLIPVHISSSLVFEDKSRIFAGRWKNKKSSFGA